MDRLRFVPLAAVFDDIADHLLGTIPQKKTRMYRGACANKLYEGSAGKHFAEGGDGGIRNCGGYYLTGRRLLHWKPLLFCGLKKRPRIELHRGVLRPEKHSADVVYSNYNRGCMRNQVACV